MREARHDSRERTMTRFPEHGCAWPELQSRLQALSRDDVDWRGGRAPLHVYYAGEDVADVARHAFTLFMDANALAPKAFPSVARMERELVDATLDLLHAPQGADGVLTSGGTESIVLAMKTAREYSAHVGTFEAPFEVLMPRSAHPAFDKAAQLLGMRIVRVPVGCDYAADVQRMEEMITPRTVMLVASAPSLPYGVVDPVADLAAVARARRLWLHVDACIGGFLAPFVRRAGYPVPDFDLGVEGVTSLSADAHKYGYAPKGVSVLLYASHGLMAYRWAEIAEWPKGSYRTPTLCGTRPGGAIAAAWAVVRYLGASGYLALARRIMFVRERMFEAIGAIDDLHVLGRPQLATFAYASRAVDMLAVADQLALRGWYMSRLADPPAIHHMLNIAHEPIVDRYANDLREATAVVSRHSLRADNRAVVTY
jgi:glutamate/tyrosine decarboxylase-like PLP-dependent enzyme